MQILIAVASKHGSTYEIAEAIGDALRSAGHTVAVHDVNDKPSLAGVDAAIVGSAVYMGNWLDEARRFVDSNSQTLAQMPVWLFSSGPLGATNPQPKGDPAGIEAMMAQTGARGHQVFVGKLDQDDLGLGERLVVRAVKAPYGDFRDWDAIRAWARAIDKALAAVATPGG
jgi:menaquinone-dependent protoporphyrinogen oxidase